MKPFASVVILCSVALHSNAFCMLLPMCNTNRPATINLRLPTATNQRGYREAVRTTNGLLATPSSSNESESKVGTFVKDETLSGLVVALASIPMSIAFANIAGVSPLVGIWSSVMLGLVSALVGGSPGLIAGSAGVVVVPLAPLLAAHGPAAMAPCVLLAAGLQLICGLSQVGKKVMRLVDDNVMKGFLNGLGLLLAQSQLTFFTSLAGAPLAVALGLAGVTVATMTWLPRLTRAVPPALAGVAAATAIASLLPMVAPSLAASCQVATLAGVAAASGGSGDVVNTFAGGWRVLPTPLDLRALAATPLSLWQACVPAAMSVAAIAVLETLLAAKVAADSQDTTKPPAAAAIAESSTSPLEVENEANSVDGHASEGDSMGGSDSVVTGDQSEDRVLLGLGLGNAMSALCGGFGGCGLIPQTVLNGQAGGRTRLSSGAYAVAMALSVVCFAPVIGAIPVASLSGLMLTVAAATVQVPYSKHVLSKALKRPRKELQQQESQPEQSSAADTLGAQSKLAVLACTSATCFFVDMAGGIGVGVALTKFLTNTSPSSKEELPETAS